MMSSVFKALCDPTRRHVIEFLSGCCCAYDEADDCCKAEECSCEAGTSDCCPSGSTASNICCHVTGKETITSTVSHHLKELTEAGLIVQQKCGKYNCFEPNAESLRAAGNYLLKLAGGEHKTSCSCCEEGCC
ncbi:MAG: winged helix-turn-helix transcriptional regulator [Armatimonadetes bacterium]|nr:winged helix-turn-helix transcriptional regulator [Armatimonadota bacterium]